jgi:hypothetical protein
MIDDPEMKHKSADVTETNETGMMRVSKMVEGAMRIPGNVSLEYY